MYLDFILSLPLTHLRSSQTPQVFMKSHLPQPKGKHGLDTNR